MVKGPRIFLNAVAEDEEEFAAVRDNVTDTLERAMQDGTTDTGRLQQVMRRTLGSWIARELHRRPMIVPVVTDLAVKSKK